MRIHVPMKWKEEVALDDIAATMLGVIAVLAAILAILHTNRSMVSARAQAESSRITSDIGARISATGLSRTVRDYFKEREVLMLEMEATNRVLAAQRDGDAAAIAIGQAQFQAAQELRVELNATVDTMAGKPLDSYAASLLNATDEQFLDELLQQNRLVDEAEKAGAQDGSAVFGISLLALAGVLLGVAVVFKRGRAAYMTLAFAGLVMVWAALMGVLAFA